MNQIEGQAILGSKNGAGCAYLVAQHKAQLGVKTITTVTLWADKERELDKIKEFDPMISMYFKIVDVE